MKRNFALMAHTVTVPATPSLIGKSALILQIGQDPIEGIISKIDTISGLILEMIIKDENKEKKAIDVKNKVVLVLPWVYRVFLFVKGLFGKKA